MSQDCCVALPHDATGLSAVCGISWSYSLFLVVNPITVDNFALLFNCRLVGWTQTLWQFRLEDLSIYESLYWEVWAWYCVLVRPTGVKLLDFFCSSIHLYVLLSPYLCYISFVYIDLYVLGDDKSNKLGIFNANQTYMCLDSHQNQGYIKHVEALQWFFCWLVQGSVSFVDPFCYLCFMFVFVILQGTKIFKYCTCPAGRVTYNFHSSCKHMHMSIKSVCNKEHKWAICNTTSSSNSSLSTRPVHSSYRTSALGRIACPF